MLKYQSKHMANQIFLRFIRQCMHYWINPYQIRGLCQSYYFIIPEKCYKVSSLLVNNYLFKEKLNYLRCKIKYSLKGMNEASF